MYHGSLHNLETQTTWIHIFASAWTSWVTLSELLHLLITMIASASEYLALWIFYLKTLAPWTKSYNNHREYIKKQRHYFANKGPSSQSYGFSNSHVLMWELDHKESWSGAFEWWCWRRLSRVPWTARRSNQSVLKEISPEYSLEGLMLKLKLQYFGHLMQRTDSLEKTLMLGKIEDKEKGTTEDEMVGWHHRLDGHEFEQAPGAGDRQGSLECCSPWGCKVVHDWATEMNWTWNDFRKWQKL